MPDFTRPELITKIQEAHKPINFTGTNFEGQDISGLDFSNTKLNSSNFNHANIEKLNLKDSELANTGFSNTKGTPFLDNSFLENFSFAENNTEKFLLNNCQLKTVEINSKAKFTFKNSYLERVKFKVANEIQMNSNKLLYCDFEKIDNLIELKKAELNYSNFNLGGNETVKINLTDCQLTKTGFGGSYGGITKIEGTFYHNKFQWETFEGGEWDNGIFSSNKFSEFEFHNFIANHTNFENNEFQNSDIFGGHFNQLIFRENRFMKGQLELNFNSCRVFENSFEDLSIRLTNNDSEFYNNNFNSCMIGKFKTFKNINNCTFQDTEFLECDFTELDNELNNSFLNCVFKNCIAEENVNNLKKDEKGFFNKLFGK